MKRQSGQVLLVTVMLLATALTFVLAVTFRSTTDTKITKLEEENQRALAAAEAGIEKAIKTGITGSFSTMGFSEYAGIDLSSSSVSEETTTADNFVTPLLKSDEQYIFYLADYPGLSLHPFTGNLTFYFGSSAVGSCSTRSVPAIELTVVYSITNIATKRFIIEPCADGKKISGDSLLIPTQESNNIGGVDFNYVYSSIAINPPNTNPKVLIIRNLFASTRVGVVGAVGSSLPLQGKTYVSEARSTSGVAKKVRFFQSYPQIPAEFFITSF